MSYRTRVRTPSFAHLQQIPAAIAAALCLPDRLSGQYRFCYVRCGPLIMHENQQPQTEAFELSAAEREAIPARDAPLRRPACASIEALKIVQKQRGWVPDGAIDAIADVLGIPASDVEGVATFYSQIFRQPVGRHAIRYCDSAVCHINGYQGIQAALEKKLNIKPGQTTFDGRFTLLPTCCLGICEKGQT
ncbi:NADH-quinone oxidoreductase subunit NuoE [Escherichia coli]